MNAAFIDTGGSSGESDLSDCKVSTILANCLSTTVKGYYFLKYRALKKKSQTEKVLMHLCNLCP